MATAGPNAPTSASDDSAVGTVTWFNVTNIELADGNYSTATLVGSAISHYAVAGTFGFSIPGTATINGIQVDVLCMGTSTAVVQDNSIRLYKAGVLTGADKAVASAWNNFPTTSYRTYGGPADLWGAAWTPTDINSATFQAGVSAVNNSPSVGTAYIDFIRITITYSSTNQVKTQCIVVKPPQAAYDLTQKPD